MNDRSSKYQMPAEWITERRVDIVSGYKPAIRLVSTAQTAFPADGAVLAWRADARWFTA